MQEMGLICKQLRLRYYSTTNRKYKVYRNRIQQNFMTETPNMVWVSDITHVHDKDKLHSIGVIIDLYAQMGVAHKVSATADVAFIQVVFDAAFEMRGLPEGLISWGIFLKIKKLLCFYNMLIINAISGDT